MRNPAPLRPALPLLLMLAGLAGGCGTSTSSPFQGQTAQAQELAVYNTVIHFVTDNYQPRGQLGAPMAWCLAVGRRSQVAEDPNRRGDTEPWNPPARLLAVLSDVEPRVVPVSACSHAEGREEILEETGAPAILLTVSQPVWETAQRAVVDVRMRESPVARDAARCRLIRGVESWQIQDCV